MAHLQWLRLRLRLQIIGFWELLHGPSDDPRRDPAPIKISRRLQLRLRAKCSDSGSSGSGSSSASLARRFWAAGRMLSGQDGVEWLRGR